MKAGGCIPLLLFLVFYKKALGAFMTKEIPPLFFPVSTEETFKLMSEDDPFKCSKSWINAGTPPAMIAYHTTEKKCYGVPNATLLNAPEKDFRLFVLLPVAAQMDACPDDDYKDNLAKVVSCHPGWKKFAFEGHVHCYNVKENVDDLAEDDLSNFIETGCKSLRSPNYVPKAASIHSQEEERFLVSEFSKTTKNVRGEYGLLLGLETDSEKEGKCTPDEWSWIDGSKMDYTNWKENDRNKCHGVSLMFEKEKSNLVEWRSFERNQRDLLCKYSINLEFTEEMEKWKLELKKRKMHYCPPSGEWSAWSEWTKCSDTCGMCGMKEGSRTCKTAHLECPCEGETVKKEPCGEEMCGDPKQACCEGFKHTQRRKQDNKEPICVKED
ncbi:hypothetical protein L596_017787 [Steinernema carpocapsae]|uniref:C-type lectin domain-containing protein n=1 Tax=Steinernema carpocapsae TaxID=34508 RepID=A0A4U5N2Z9_STECR|nr:hypothetical protein L596_017787 [Steinernema carpocapsae]